MQGVKKSRKHFYTFSKKLLTSDFWLPAKLVTFIKIFKEMVLSRIWSAFIIVAIVVASIKYLFSDNYKAIYNDLVVGKSGDTVQITKVPVQF